jgi:hypothetical protein
LKPMVGTTKKSMAAMSGAWFRRKVDQPWLGGPQRLDAMHIEIIIERN